MPVVIEEVEMDVTAPERAAQAPARQEMPRPRPEPREVLAILRREEHRRARLREG